MNFNTYYFKEAKLINIIYVDEPIYVDGVLASGKYDRKNTIFISKKLNDRSKKWVKYHEIGHVYYDHLQNITIAYIMDKDEELWNDAKITGAVKSHWKGEKTPYGVDWYEAMADMNAEKEFKKDLYSDKLLNFLEKEKGNVEINEAFYKMDKVNVGLSTQIYEVYKNPKEYEIDQISNNFFKLNDYNPKGLSKALRGFLDKKNGNVYVWNANLLHDKAARVFNLNDTYSYRLIFNPKKKSISVESNSSPKDINIKNFNEEAIKNLRNTGYKYITWLDYENEDEYDDNSKIKYNLDTMEREKYTEEGWD